MHREIEQIQQDILEIKNTLNLQTQEEYLNVHQAAKFTGFSKHTIYKYCEHGRIPVIRLGGVLRFKRSELRAWMESKSVAIAQ